MSFKPCALVVAVSLAVAGTAQAGDDTIDLSTPERWAPGETVTVQFKDEFALDLKAKMDDGRPLPPAARTGGTRGTFVLRCDAADAAGRRTRATVHVADWSSAGEGPQDTSLRGATLETGPSGWTLLAASVTPSVDARHWLDQEFGRGWETRGDELAASRPSGPVAVGQTWEVEHADGFSDALRSVAVFGKPEKTTARAKLHAATADSVKVLVEAETPLVTSGPQADDAPPNVVRVHQELSGTPGQWRRTGSSVHATRIALTAPNPERHMTVTCEGMITRMRKHAAGGTIPAASARNGAVRISAGAPWRAGEGFAEEGHDTRIGSRTVVDSSGADGTTRHDEDDVTWSAVYRCTAVDEAGRPKTMRIEVRAWKAVLAGTEDTSLTGAVIESSRRGWKFASEGPAKPSKRALDWVSSRFTSMQTDDAMRAAMTPLVPVAAGDAWTPDAAEVVASVRSWLPLPMSGTPTMRARAESAGNGTARIAYSSTVPIDCSPDCNGATPLRNGTVEITGTTDGAVGAWDRTGALSEQAKVAIDAPGEEQGTTTRVRITRSRTRTRTPLAPDR